MVMKLLLTVLVVVAALGVLRLTNRGKTPDLPPRGDRSRVPEAEDLVRCNACGSYIPAGTGCPQCSERPTP